MGTLPVKKKEFTKDTIGHTRVLYFQYNLINKNIKDLIFYLNLIKEHLKPDFYLALYDKLEESTKIASLVDLIIKIDKDKLTDSIYIPGLSNMDLFYIKEMALNCCNDINIQYIINNISTKQYEIYNNFVELRSYFITLYNI